MIAVTTDARALSNSRAEKLTFDAVTALITAGADHIYLKIDSTMRGSVPGQIAGAIAAWRTRHADARAVVCPAYPHMGRTVESGRLLVRGEPVHLTAIGRDPVSPVTTSDMIALVPASSGVTLADAATTEGLAALARTIAGEGPSVIPVGSGGLAGAMAEVWGRGKEAGQARLKSSTARDRILILVTSLNPVSHAQAAKVLSQFPDVVVMMGPAQRTTASVADDLAARFADRAISEQWDVFGLVGGDGARAALRNLDAAGIHVLGSVSEGIPFGTIHGGRCDGTTVFTKAGGFGDEDALVKVIKRMRE